MSGREERSLSFGSAAAAYERARPSYPPDLVRDLMALRPRDVLDVGSGTGRVARLFVDQGCRVLAVEADARMAEVARSRGVEVEVTRFEDWDPRGRRFDLVVSGQAWHWVDPDQGAAKAAAVLRPGGHLAAFWNVGSHDPGPLQALRTVYEREAPGLVGTTSALAPQDDENVDRARRLLESGFFEAPAMRAYAWDIEYTSAEWVDLISTYSDHIGLPAPTRAALLQAVASAIDAQGGRLVHHYSTVLILARRAAAAEPPP